MNIGDLGRPPPSLVLGTATNTLALGGVSISSNSTVPSAGFTLVAVSSNTAAWEDRLSFGSNTNDVSSGGTMGASGSNTRADHVHRGVHLLTANASNSLYGDINLVAGAGISLSISGNTITIQRI